MERERGTETKMWRRGIDINGSETHYFIRKTPFFPLLCHGLFCFLSWASCSKISLILVLVYGTAHEEGTYKKKSFPKGAGAVFPALKLILFLEEKYSAAGAYIKSYSLPLD